MKKIATQLLGLAVGVVWAILLFWFWRQDVDGQRKNPVASVRPAPTAPSAAVTPADTLPDTAAREILAAFESSLLGADARTREGLLTFKDDSSFRQFLERAQKSGLTILGQLDGLRTVRVQYDDFAALRNELQQNAGDYASATANALVNIPHAPAREDRAPVDQVPFRNNTLAFLGVPDDHSQWGSGTTIAILDTGVAPDTTFGTGRLRYLDIGLGTAPGNGREDGHGTAVAALAAGLAPDAPGVSPSASILSVRVTDGSGTSDIFTISQGIIAAVDAGARIVNVSLGGYSTNSTLSAAIGYANEHGALIVAAAGNDQAAQLAWPAADPRVVSVGAVDRAEQQVSFSNSGAQLQLTAPGYGVQTAWLNGQRAYVDGTSASAPLVAGALAAIMSQNPSLTSQQAWALLTRTASDAGAPGTDPAYGSGILNLGWAMNSNTPGYVDTAVSSPYFDAANNQMDFVVQNRSSQAVSGLTLTVSGRPTSYLIPSLSPGESYVVRMPVDPSVFRTAAFAAGALSYTAELTNPSGLVDRVPANNRRSSVLVAPR